MGHDVEKRADATHRSWHRSEHHHPAHRPQRRPARWPQLSSWTRSLLWRTMSSSSTSDVSALAGREPVLILLCESPSPNKYLETLVRPKVQCPSALVGDLATTWNPTLSCVCTRLG